MWAPASVARPWANRSRGSVSVSRPMMFTVTAVHAGWARVTERKVENGSHVILELRSHCCFDRVMAGVVGAGRELVHGQLAVRKEQLDGEDADDVDCLGHLFCDRSRPGSDAFFYGRRHGDLSALPVHLDGLYRLVYDVVAPGPSCDHHREFLLQVQEWLGHDRRAFRKVSGDGLERLLPAFDHEDAPPVISAVRELQDGPWPVGDHRLQVVAAHHRGKWGHGYPGRRKGMAHREFVGHSSERPCRWTQYGSGRLQVRERVEVHHFVIERDNVALLGESTQVVGVDSTPESSSRGHDRCGVVKAICQEAEFYCQRDGRLMGHPCQLPGTDDSEDRTSAHGVKGRQSERIMDRQNATAPSTRGGSASAV